MEAVMIHANYVDRISNDQKDCWITWLRKKIRSMRKEFELTQWEIGEMMGYSQSYISQLENDNFRWDRLKVEKFIQAFGIDWKDVTKRVLVCMERGCKSCSCLQKYH